MRFSLEENEILRQHVIINNFVQAVGCHYEEAKTYLTNSGWHYEHALSQFFEEASIQPLIDSKVCCICRTVHDDPRRVCTPTNTPTGSSAFPDSLDALLTSMALITASDSPQQIKTFQFSPDTMKMATSSISPACSYASSSCHSPPLQLSDHCDGVTSQYTLMSSAGFQPSASSQDSGLFPIDMEME